MLSSCAKRLTTSRLSLVAGLSTKRIACRMLHPATPKEYKTIYNIELTANINHPDVHKITYDFAQIVNTENLTMIQLFYQLYIEKYEQYVGNTAAKSGLIHDIGWNAPVSFGPNYVNKLMYHVLWTYVRSMSDADWYTKNAQYRHLYFVDIEANRKEILEWFEAHMQPESWIYIRESTKKTGKHTQISKIFDLVKDPV